MSLKPNRIIQLLKLDRNMKADLKIILLDTLVII